MMTSPFHRAVKQCLRRSRNEYLVVGVISQATYYWARCGGLALLFPFSFFLSFALTNVSPPPRPAGKPALPKKQVEGLELRWLLLGVDALQSAANSPPYSVEVLDQLTGTALVYVDWVRAR